MSHEPVGRCVQCEVIAPHRYDQRYACVRIRGQHTLIRDSQGMHEIRFDLLN